MVTNGLGRDEQLLGDIGIPKTLGRKYEDLGLARGEPRRVRCCCTPRTARHTACAHRVQAPADQRGRSTRPELLEAAQGVEQILLNGGVRERIGGLVWAADHLPYRGGLAVLTPQMQRERLGARGWDLGQGVRPLQPQREFPDRPVHAPTQWPSRRCR